MSKVLIVGDIHNKVQKAETAMGNWTGPIIQVGDIFDDFHDTVNDAIEAAEWLKQSILQPNRTHLMGNHDIQYMLPLNSGIYCSGYSVDKHKAIRSVLTDEDWSHVKYFLSVNNCWFSHAGITRMWFEHPINGLTLDGINEQINKAVHSINDKTYANIQCLYAADYFRGGRSKKGGLLWNDWRNSDFIEGVTQIVGHTPYDSIQCTKDSSINSININVDTHMRQVITLDTITSAYEIIEC